MKWENITTDMPIIFILSLVDNILVFFIEYQIIFIRYAALWHMNFTQLITSVSFRK